MVDELAEQLTTKSGFIRAYGMFWSAREVDWTGYDSNRRLELLGRINMNRGALQMVNFWDQQGIYILDNDHGPYYVGQTIGQNLNLGKRLRHHHTGSNGSPHKGKWDRFSWFGWRRVLSGADHRGLQKLGRLPGGVLTSSKNTVQDIESLLIHATGTRSVGNAKEETFVAAVRWEQVLWSDRDHYLDKVKR